jgi:apolipoprotein N-acyltransferase
MDRLRAIFDTADRWSLFVATTTGISLGIGTLVFSLWPLSLVGFAGVVHLLHTLDRRSAFLQLLLVGAIAYGCSFYPLFWSTLPLDWLGLGPMLGLGIILSVWLLTVLTFSVSFAALLQVAVGRIQRLWALVLLPASLYVLSDALGTLLFSLLFSGPAGSIGLDFSMGSLGYQLADSAILLQTAWFGGLYALLWMQALFGSLLYVAIYLTSGRQRVGWVTAWCGLWLIMISSSIAAPRVVGSGDTQSLTVGVVSTYDETQTGSSQSEQIMRSLKLLPAPVDLVALPEDARFNHTLGGSSARVAQAQTSARYLLDSTAITTTAGLAAQIQLLDTQNLRVATSSKDFLMVFGEYIPWIYRGIAHLIGQADVITRLDGEHGYYTTDSNLFSVDDTPISVKLCSDGMSPFLYARDTHQGATVLFNLASHGWFHQSRLMHGISIRVGQVRAVENSRWYIRAGHDSPGYIIDHRGQVRAESLWFDHDPLVAEVPLRSTLTLYSQLRGWVLLIPLLLALVLVYPSARARIADRTDNTKRSASSAQ